MASWTGFQDLDSSIAYYEYYFGPQCITASMYCGGAACVAASGGSCRPSCTSQINSTLSTAFRATRGWPVISVNCHASMYMHVTVNVGLRIALCVSLTAVGMYTSSSYSLPLTAGRYYATV